MRVVWTRKHPGTVKLYDAFKMVPDLLALLRDLVRDKTVARGVRVKLGLLLVYLASPIDLVPDFVPIIGYADDVVVVALVLRSVVRSAGVEPLHRHWRGTPAGLAVIERLADV